MQVLCSVYSAMQHAIACAPHVLLSLILYKMVDPVPEVSGMSNGQWQGSGQWAVAGQGSEHS
jgi:hypothetical protein